jgi:hypothetical protein
MTDYTVNLSPTYRPEGTEGAMDTSIVGGISYQRTVSMLLVPNTGDPTQIKMIGTVKDGAVFNDTIHNGNSDLDFVE